MADVSKNGKYLRANFNVWYDPSADNIHLTTDDKDFGPNGAHLTAKKGTASDKNLRAGLAKYGCPHNEQSANAHKQMQLAEEALAALTTEQIDAVAQRVKDSKKDLNG